MNNNFDGFVSIDVKRILDLVVIAEKNLLDKKQKWSEIVKENYFVRQARFLWFIPLWWKEACIPIGYWNDKKTIIEYETFSYILFEKSGGIDGRIQRIIDSTSTTIQVNNTFVFDAEVKVASIKNAAQGAADYGDGTILLSLAAWDFLLEVSKND